MPWLTIPPVWFEMNQFNDFSDIQLISESMEWNEYLRDYLFNHNNSKSNTIFICWVFEVSDRTGYTEYAGTAIGGNNKDPTFSSPPRIYMSLK